MLRTSARRLSAHIRLEFAEYLLNVNADENVNITINDQPVKRVNETETLGMTTDQHLNWSRHVEEKFKKISSAIGALKRIRPFVTIETVNKI